MRAPSSLSTDHCCVCESANKTDHCDLKNEERNLFQYDLSIWRHPHNKLYRPGVYFRHQPVIDAYRSMHTREAVVHIMRGIILYLGSGLFCEKQQARHWALNRARSESLWMNGDRFVACLTSAQRLCEKSI